MEVLLSGRVDEKSADAIDRLVRLYKDCVYNTGGWLTENGNVNLMRVQVIVDALGEVEDEIFKKRHSDEVRLYFANSSEEMY